MGLVAVRKHPGVETPGYCRVVPAGRSRRDAENGNRDGRAPQASPSRAANDGLGWTNGAKGAESRSDAVTIARHFNAGFNPQIIPSPAGTTGVFKMKSLSNAETMRRAFSRPGGTLAGAGDDPALKRRAIVGMSRWDEAGRDAENGNRDGRAPQQCPSRAANGSLGWTNGAKDV